MTNKKNNQAGPRSGTTVPVQANPSRAQTKKDEMRVLAGQAAANSPGIEDRIAQARGLISSNPLGASVLPPIADASATPTPENFIPGGEAGASGSSSPVHMTSPRGRYQLVDLHLIDENPFNARKTYREARIKEMKASLAANGQETPGTATIRNGRYILAAGHYRYKGLHQLDAPHMGLMVIPGLSDRALYEMSYRENAEREDQTAFDNALAWRELLDTKVYRSEQEVADAIGMSAPNVNKTLGILRLSQPVRDLIAEDPTRYALSVLYELALFDAVAGTERTMSMAKAVASGDIGRLQIQEARALIQDKAPRKGRETSRQYKIKVGGISEGTLKEWTSGKVAFEVQIEDPAARAQFVAEMRERFESSE